MPVQLPHPRDAALLVAQITDPHLYGDPTGTLLGVHTTDTLQGVLRHLQADTRRPDMLLVTGDLTQDGSPAAYARFLALASEIPAPLHALPGNHDARDAFRTALGSRAEPVIDAGAWRFVLLDSTIPGENGGRLGPDQLQLLREAAHVGADRHVLVCMHHNPVRMLSEWLDTMTIANADALFDTLKTLPRVAGLLWGHVHQAYDGESMLSPGHVIKLMATPSTCVQFGPQTDRFAVDDIAPGYRWLRLHPDGRIDTEVVRVTDLPGATPDMGSNGY